MKQFYLLRIQFIVLLCLVFMSAKSQPLGVNITPDGPLDICAGEEIVLIAQTNGGISPYSYLWSGSTAYLNSTTQPIVIFMSNLAGTYYLYVTVTDSNMDIVIDSVQINVKPLPNLIASNDTTICNGESLTLTASGANTILWFDQNDILIGLGTDVSVAPTNNQVYTVVGVTAGCTKNKEIAITVIQPPVAFAGYDDSLCEGQTLALIDAWATNYSSIFWTTSGDGIFSDATSINPVYFPGAGDITSGSVNLTLTAIGNGPCQNATSQLTLSIFPYPIADAGLNQSICEGETASLNGSGSGSYVWSTGETTSSISVSPLTSQYYYLTVSANGCESIDSVYVEIRPLPLLTLTPDQTICNNDSILLTAGGGIFYLWNTGDTTMSITVAPTISTIFTVTVTDNGCSSSGSVQIDISNPIASAGPNQTICQGNSTTLTASGGISYLWNTGETSESITVAPLSDATYTVTVTDLYGCTASALAQVTVQEITYSITPETDLCEGETTMIGVNGGSAWLWSGGESTNEIFVSPVITQTYYVTITDGLCEKYDSVIVNVNENPALTITPDTTICKNDILILEASGGLNYLWNTGDTTSSITVSPNISTTFTVIATNNFCSSSASVVVNVDEVIADAGSNQSICLGESVNLQATGGNSYLWSTGDTLAEIIVTPISNSIYYVTATSLTGCSDIDSVLVEVESMNIFISQDDSICIGESIQLSVSGGQSYMWSNGETDSIISVIPATSQYYSVTAYGQNCTQTDSVYITVFSLPVTNISSDTSICLTSSIDLWASGGTSYEWSTGETSDTISVSPNSTTLYSVTITDQMCSAIESVTVEVQTVNASAGINQIICLGDTTTLTANGGTSYIWNTFETTQTIQVSPSGTSTYRVTVTNNSGCTGTAQVIVHVTDLHTFITGDTEICYGESTTLTANGGVFFDWSTGDSTAIITVNPSQTQLYTVEIGNFMCSEMDSIEVIVHPLPITNAGNTQYIIQGDSVNLSCSSTTGFGVLNCFWQPSTGLSSPFDCATLAFPDTTTLYTLICFNEFGCSSSDTVSVVVYPPGVYIQAQNDGIICSGDSMQLDCEIILGNQPPYSFEWTPGISLSSTIVKDPYAFPSITTTYYVKVTDNIGQTSIDSVVVFVNETPVADAGQDIEICFGEQATLTAAGNGLYQWSSGETNQQIIVSPNNNTEYGLLVNNQGCIDTDSVWVVVKPIPEIYISDDIEICYGDSALLTGDAQGIWSWNTGNSNPNLIVSPEASIVYSITAELDNCFNSDSVLVTVNPLPDFVLSNDLIISEIVIGQWVTFDILPDIYTTYQFYINDNLIQEGASNSFTTNILQNEDVVTAIAISDKQCNSTVKWTTIARTIPNGFTPNNDGVNDLFLEGVQLIIINRWGEELYRGNGGWNGTYQNQVVPAGTYFYIIELTDPENSLSGTLKGSVLLIK